METEIVVPVIISIIFFLLCLLCLFSVGFKGYSYPPFLSPRQEIQRGLVKALHFGLGMLLVLSPGLGFFAFVGAGDKQVACLYNHLRLFFLAGVIIICVGLWMLHRSIYIRHPGFLKRFQSKEDMILNKVFSWCCIVVGFLLILTCPFVFITFVLLAPEYVDNNFAFLWWMGGLFLLFGCVLLRQGAGSAPTRL